MTAVNTSTNKTSNHYLTGSTAKGISLAESRVITNAPYVMGNSQVARENMNQESRDMESQVDILMEEVNKLQRVKNEKFYDEHVKNEYKWEEYVDYKDKSNTKVGKLIVQKEKNLKDQNKSVA